MTQRAFKTNDIFKQKFIDYIEHCNDKERFANIAGFCVFADITRGTFYEQEKYYSDTYNKVRNMLEDETLQKNTYMAQLYIKNTFGYSDKKETINTNLNVDMTEEEADEILKKAGVKVGQDQTSESD